jgi:shikimate dehydrogenase
MSARSVVLFGDPVSRSLSPAMQNAAFAACGIDCEYVLRELHRDALAPAVKELSRNVQVLGANVTIPHKEAIVPLLDELDPLAAQIGAVNTVSRQGPRLKGWNTDVEGFRRALDECGYVVEGKAVVILGAGGAARAVSAAIDSRVDRLWVIARNPEQAARLCRDLGLKRAEPRDMNHMREPIAEADLVINATPADLAETWRIRPDRRLFDLRSRRSAEGRSMLLHQGAASFEIWTDRKAPLEAMRAALERAAQAVLA